MKKNIIITLITAYITGRIIGGLWAWLNPDKAKKVYTGFTKMIRRVTGGFIKEIEESCGFGHSIFKSEIPLEQSEITGRDITAEDKAALEAALGEILRRAENLGNVISLDDLEAGNF